MSEELVSVPQDLKLLSDDELGELETRATAEFDRLNENDDVTPEALEQLMSLTDGIERLRAENAARVSERRRQEGLERARLARQREGLQSRVHSGPGEGGSNTGGNNDIADFKPIDGEGIAAAAARGATAALVAALGDRGGDLVGQLKRATSLSEAQRHAPRPKTPAAQLAVTAAVDIPGLARNDDLSNLDSLANAFYKRARSMSVTNGSPQEQLVATIRNEFEYTIDDRTTPGQVDELFKRLTSRDKQQALVAGGGWCAPSEIRYEFFNIACTSGLIDLPTFGVSRGGIRYPTSPSIADAFSTTGLAPFAVAFTNASIPWLWTETDDQAAATGASPRKPTLRVPCPSFNERRLECYGITVTAGNLTDDAYPEATQNFLKVVLAAHAHAQNSRIISTMTSLATAAVSTGSYGVTGQPAFNAILSGVELAAVDYREKYGMCDDDVLEVVMPMWVPEVIRADLAHRRDPEWASVTEATIGGWFSDRGIRVQWVDDYQVRGAGQFGNSSTAMTTWPTTVTYT